MSGPIATGPQRERLLAALEARQAEEGAQDEPDYLQLLPEALEPPRRTLRDWFRANFNSYVLYEYRTGRPSVDCACRACIDRAAGRQLRFSLTVVGVLLLALSIGVSALSTPY
jgi:hypothetical protein